MQKQQVLKVGIIAILLGIYLFIPSGCQAYARSYPKASRPLMNRELSEQLQKVYTNPGNVPQMQIQKDGKTVDLPLKHTHVDARLTGPVGRVTVTQKYHNPYRDPLEAIYVFPLPENSAVDDMRIVIGDRTIQAEIKKRADARRTYEQAKQRGNTAALLEQERPNIFTQSIANIAPGEEIDVVLRYVQTLTYDAGAYEFVFPMVVGPRFVPGRTTGTRSGSGWTPDTDKVPDASRISPAYVGAGLRSGHDISLEVVVNAGLPISDFDVPTHRILQEDTDKETLALKLSPKDSIPNRDFILKYRVDGPQAQVALLTHPQDPSDGRSEGGFFTLIVQPPPYRCGSGGGPTGAHFLGGCFGLHVWSSLGHGQGCHATRHHGPAAGGHLQRHHL